MLSNADRWCGHQHYFRSHLYFWIFRFAGNGNQRCGNCMEMQIGISPKNVAVLTRGRIYSDTDIKGLWKSAEIELYAKAAYEWKYGTRKKAYENTEKAT